MQTSFTIKKASAHDSLFLSDSLGHTPNASVFHRAVAGADASKLISRLLATCEVLQHDVFLSHGISFRIGAAGQLVVLQVSDNSIAAAHGWSPLAISYLMNFVPFRFELIGIVRHNVCTYLYYFAAVISSENVFRIVCWGYCC